MDGSGVRINGFGVQELFEAYWLKFNHSYIGFQYAPISNVIAAHVSFCECSPRFLGRE